jgi:2'-5' RNA ligase
MPENGADPVFVALSLPDVARTRLSELCSALRFPARATEARFVEPENYHVTLRFLGSLSPSVIDGVANRIRTLGSEAQAPSCGYVGCAGLPRRGRAHVFVATLSDPVGALTRLYQSLSDSLLDMGIPNEQRPFHPHVTLARFKKATDVRGLVAVARAPQEEWAPHAVMLYRSQRRRSGVRYVPLAQQPFSP